MIQCPRTFKACETAKWIKHELDEIFGRLSPTYIVIKAFEGRSKGAAYEERVRLEGIAHLCASALGFKDIARKRKPTIAKDLGLKGRARYLRSILTPLRSAEFEDLDPLSKEAILAAWSDLKD